jgi:8-oxo-dGTP diphosphatase
MINCTFEDGGPASLRHAVVDGIVIRDGQILMVKRTGKLLEGGKWGLVGGFAERDETMAQAIAREIYEESGWTINNLNLLTIVDRPDRPAEDRQNISFVYICDAVEQTGEPDWESDEAKWFPIDALPPSDSIAFDHESHINVYKRFLVEKSALPIV